ncbi:MAG: NYN domain-containing protein [archaeon]
MKKVIVFVDGNNWYHNVKRYYSPSDVDITKIVDFIKTAKKYDLLEIRWYISVPSISDGEKMYFQHLSFLDYLRNKGVKVITRKLQRLSNKQISKRKRDLLGSLDICDVCKPIIDAQFLDLADIRKKEKGVDVAIVVDMMRLCVIDEKCDTCLLISGDADFVPALSLIKDRGKEVLTSMTPLGYSSELRRNFPFFILTPKILKECFRDYKSKKDLRSKSN